MSEVQTEQPAKPEEDILELSAIAPERPKARIRYYSDPDDPTSETSDVYELAVPTDFGAVDLRDFGRGVDEIDKLWAQQGVLSVGSQKRLELLLNQLAGLLIRGCPEHVVAAVPAVDKRGLVVRFFVNASLRTVETTGVEAMAQAYGSGSES